MRPKARSRGLPGTVSRPRTSTSTSATGAWWCRCSTRAATRDALRKLQELFPKREVVGVPGREILLGGGNVHCVTQQVPSPRVPRR